MLNRALEEDKLDHGCVGYDIPLPSALANAHAGQILSLSVYVESQSSPEMPFGSRARIYPGPAPLAEIVLDELSARYVKHPAARFVEGGDKALEHVSMETGEPQGDVESGDRMLLVAGMSSTIFDRQF
jgi:hypothetical protein